MKEESDKVGLKLNIQKNTTDRQETDRQTEFGNVYILKLKQYTQRQKSTFTAEAK